MFKALVKLSILTLLVLGAGLLLSSGKVYADTGCPAEPNAFDNAQNNHNWGVDPQYNGNHGGAMGGMIIHAYDADTKQDLSMHYHINSQIYGDNPHPGTAPNGAHIDNMNAAIYIDISGDFSERVTEHQGQTGGLLYDGGTDKTFSCAGWDAYGPADVWGGKARVGNAYVLDCGPQTQSTKFWFSNMSNPLDDNKNKKDGYWSVQVVWGQNHEHEINIPHYTEGSMNYLNNNFGVWNGGNTYVNFAWHPEPPNTGGGQGNSGGGQCTVATARNDSTWYGYRKRTHMQVYGAANGHIQRTDSSPQHNLTNWYYNNLPGSQPNNTPPGGAVVSSPKQNVDDYVPNPNGEGTNGAVTTGTWYYQPTMNAVRVTITLEVWDYPGHRGAWWAPTSNPDGTAHNPVIQDQTINCFAANCNNPLTVTGDVPGGGGAVLAGGSIYVSGSYTNTGPLALWYPALIGSDGQTHQIPGIPQPLAPGQTVTFSFEIQAPPGVQNYALSLTPSYFPGTIGSACSANVPTYEEFRASAIPKSKLRPTKEDPNSDVYSGKIDIKLTNHDIQFPAETTATLYKQPAPGGGGQTILEGPASDGVHSQGSPYLLGSSTSNHGSLGVVNAGDQFCTDMTVTPTHGWVGPTNNIVGGTGSDHQTDCDKTVNQPYAHFFGSDVKAGGGFTDSCHADQQGNIYTYSKLPAGVGGSPTNGTGGSGVQFGAEAMNIISGLGSASLRTTDPKGPAGLLFANRDSNIPATATEPDGITGGFLSPPPLSEAKNFCIPDYFSEMPSGPTIDTNTTATAGTGDLVQHFRPGNNLNGTLELNPAASTVIGKGKNYAIFVEGNVTIKHNITYDTASRSSIKDIPSFFLIVKGGNIHIDPDVTQLDGVYVAQPDPAHMSSTSTINTCWSSAFTNVDTIYASCKNQLVVNGAFVANKVFLTRSHSSLRYSQNGENNLGSYNSGSRTNCGNTDNDIYSGAPYKGDCAAEIFNFNPELYLSSPSLNPKSTGKFDSITSLPPVL